jgi:hypothetical protein
MRRHAQSAFADVLLGLLFDPKDGSDMFFQNVGLYPALAIHVIILFIVTALRA